MTRCGRKRHPLLEERDETRAHSANTLESLERTERPVGRSVTDNAAREHAADPWQRFDLALARHVQIHHGARPSSRISSYGVRFTSDDAERLAYPAVRRIRSGTGIGCRPRSRASRGVPSVEGSPVRSRRTARSNVNAARRIDGGDLSRERLTGAGIGRTATSRGAHDTHACTEDNDTGEEQQRFAFGGRWHNAKIAPPITKGIICLFPTRLFLRTGPIMLYGRRHLESHVAATSRAPPSMNR